MPAANTVTFDKAQGLDQLTQLDHIAGERFDFTNLLEANIKLAFSNTF